MNDRNLIFWLLAALAYSGLVFALRGWQLRRHARKVYQRYRDYYSNPIEVTPASRAEYAWRGLGFYEEKVREFEALGFKFIGDFENATSSRLFPQTRTFFSALLGEEGSMTAEIIDPSFVGRHRLQAWQGRLPQNLRTVFISTAFTGGARITTCDGDWIRRNVPPPGTILNTAPRGTPAKDLVARHKEAIASLIAGHPGTEVLRTQSREEFLERMQSLHALNSEFRRKSGFIFEEELLPGRLGGARYVAPMLREIRRLHALETAGEAPRPSPAAQS